MDFRFTRVRAKISPSRRNLPTRSRAATALARSTGCTGTVGAGGCNLSLGTSGTIFISSKEFGVDPNNALHAFAHADGGAFASVQAAADALVEVASTTEPDAELTAKYQARYEKFKQLYPALKSIFSERN